MNSLREALLAFTHWAAALGYPGVFLAMVADGAALPIPSEGVLMFVGFLISRGDLQPVSAFLTCLGGALTGSSVAYWIGRAFGRPVVLRFGRYLLLTEGRFTRIEQWLARHGPKAVLFSRVVPGVRVLISYPAGVWRMSYPAFIAYTAVGYGVWCVIGMSAGYLAGEHWQAIAELWGRVGLVIFLALVAGAVVALWLLGVSRSRRSPSRTETMR